jgi:hypothetical protein
MTELDITTLGGFLSTMWEVIKAVLSLNPKVFIAAVYLPGAWKLALAIVFVAGISDILGQSVVLFANRVSPRRFIVSTVMSGFLLIVSVLFYAFTIWLIVKFVMGLERSYFSTILILVSLSYAPLVFSFFTLLPYMGNFIYQTVRIWSLLALVAGVAAIAQSHFWVGIGACLLGWLFIQFITHMPIFKIKAIDAWVWRVMTGTSERMDSLMLADRLATERGKMMRKLAGKEE